MSCPASPTRCTALCIVELPHQKCGGIAQSVRLRNFWLVLLSTKWSTLSRECCKGLRIPAGPEGVDSFHKLAMVIDFRVDQLDANIVGHPL